LIYTAADRFIGNYLESSRVFVSSHTKTRSLCFYFLQVISTFGIRIFNTRVARTDQSQFLPSPRSVNVAAMAPACRHVLEKNQPTRGALKNIKQKKAHSFKYP